MTETLDRKRKRLLFHCTHMGMKENDVLFGAFARAHVADLAALEIDALEALLQNNDLDLFRWVMGQSAVPETWDTALMARLQNFNKNINNGT